MLTATAVLVAAWALLALELTPNPTTGVTLAPHFSSAEAAATGDRLLATVAPTLDDPAPRPQPTGASTPTAPAPVPLVARPDLALLAGPVAATDLEPAEVALVARARARARDNAPPFTEPMRGLSRPPTRVELAAQLVARARARDNAPPFTEPMRGLSRPPTRAELAAQLVARARARDNAPPFTEPMRGLSRPPTRAELAAQLVARARARDNAPALHRADAWPLPPPDPRRTLRTARRTCPRPRQRPAHRRTRIRDRGERHTDALPRTGRHRGGDGQLLLLHT